MRLDLLDPLLPASWGKDRQQDLSKGRAGAPRACWVGGGHSCAKDHLVPPGRPGAGWDLQQDQVCS